jgi:hypothetical protein
VSAERYFLCTTNWVGGFGYYLPRRICVSRYWLLCVQVSLDGIVG